MVKSELSSFGTSCGWSSPLKIGCISSWISWFRSCVWYRKKLIVLSVYMWFNESFNFSKSTESLILLVQLQTEQGRLILAKSRTALQTPCLSSKLSNGWTLTYPQNVSNVILKGSSQWRAHINTSLVRPASFSDHCFPIFLPFGLNKAFLMWPLMSQVPLEPSLVLFWVSYQEATHTITKVDGKTKYSMSLIAIIL